MYKVEVNYVVTWEAVPSGKEVLNCFFKSDSGCFGNTNLRSRDVLFSFRDDSDSV